jgi:excinuclease UvrABC nuclease subunit
LVDIDIQNIPAEIEKLKALMQIASNSLDFETAIELRERIAQLREIQKKRGKL